MSCYKGHIAGAVVCATGATTAAVMVPPMLGFQGLDIGSIGLLRGLTLTGSCILASLFPDIDTNSQGRKIFYGIFIAAAILLISKGMVLVAAVFGLATMFPSLSKHRGWTHTITAAILFALPAIIVPMLLYKEIIFTGLPYFAAMLIGYCSHLLLDKF